jgi:hypothetical protein
MITICLLGCVIQIGGLLLAHWQFERLLAKPRTSATDWIMPTSIALPILGWICLGHPPLITLGVVFASYPWPVLILPLLLMLRRDEP